MADSRSTYSGEAVGKFSKMIVARVDEFSTCLKYKENKIWHADCMLGISRIMFRPGVSKQEVENEKNVL
ncbi:hypothetical protein [Salinisphaera sp.]|uniref:hypothetical protein n=1 Tax=Salinisphaera sp. TaxID=1914330 RepID=UPI002D786ACD|nr:hypothetical protein [Salinisphaera sp.]HET7313009.1 hypothetical protein [Salinisphaera sp.]